MFDKAHPRHKIIKLSVIILVACCVFSVSTAFADSVPISNESELAAIGTDAITLSWDYVLSNDIPLTSLGMIMGSDGSPFTGSLDGGGHLISNLSMPLFSDLLGATISNLNLSGNVELRSSCGGGTCLNSDVGILSRTAQDSSLENVSTAGTVSGLHNVGGIIGSADNVTLSSSSSTADVAGTNNIGGLVGSIYGSLSALSDSYSSGNITGNANVGGIAGSMNSSIEARNIAATGSVAGSEIVGGIVGSADLCDYAISGACTELGTLSEISDYGTVTATDHAAGSLAGVLWSGNISGYRALGDVSDADISSPFYGPGKDRLMACDCSGISSPDYGPQLSGTSFDPATFRRSSSGGTDERVWTSRRQNEVEVPEFREIKTPDKISKPLGFQPESKFSLNTSISFISAKDNMDISKVKAFGMLSTENVKVNAKYGELLQVDMKSSSKDPIELWILSPDKTWVLAGVITFDLNGKAILPLIKFKATGEYSLVLNKPLENSTEGEMPRNISGSILVTVG